VDCQNKNDGGTPDLCVPLAWQQTIPREENMTKENDTQERGGQSRGASQRQRSGQARKGDDSGHGGWFGDSEGHSRAARKGWGEETDSEEGDAV
jgi:hypothetical protein